MAIALGVALVAQDFEAGMRAYQKQDYATAAKEWTPVAEHGSAQAQFNLGLLYYEGRGVPQDFETAARWFQRAANQGFDRAQRNLGEMYAVGKGVKRDYAEAYKWFSICAAGGSAPCRDFRDQMGEKLSGKKLAAAQRLAREWKAKAEGQTSRQ